MVELIEQVCVRLRDAMLASKPYAIDHELTEVKNLFKDKFHAIDSDIIHQIVPILEQIGQLLHRDFKYYYDGTKDKPDNTMKTMTFIDLLEHVRTHDVNHNLGKNVFQSSFHAESFFTHSFLVMIYACVKAIELHVDKHKLIAIALGSLFHDIGKLKCTVSLHGSDIACWLHDVMGAGLFMTWYDSFKDIFTYDEWLNMSMAINCHMIGLHSLELDENAMMKLNTIRVYNDEVKLFVECISYGDILGSIKTTAGENEKDEIYFKNRDKLI